MSLRQVLLLVVKLQRPEDIMHARQRARQIAALLTFSIQDQTRIAAAVSEIARNIYQISLEGTTKFSLSYQNLSLVVDIGCFHQGLTHTTDAFSENSSYPNAVDVQKIVEKFSTQYTTNEKKVTFEMFLPKNLLPITPKLVETLTQKLLHEAPQAISDEMYQQNKEILYTLKLLRQSRDELEDRVQERTAQLLFANQQLKEENLERKRIETSLEQTQERLHLALRSAKAGTWHWNIVENTYDADEYMYPLFGLTTNQTLSWEEALHTIHPEDRQKLKTTAFEALIQKIPLETEFRVIFPNRDIHYLMTRGKVFYKDKNTPARMTGVCWDVTEQKKSQEWLRLYQHQSAQAARANLMGEMASALSHELNQPLTAISTFANGCVHRLENQMLSLNEFSETVRDLAEEAKRASEILNRIKNFIRKGQISREVVAINKIIENALKLICYETPEPRLQFLCKLDSNLPTLTGDKIQIEQVILNLLRNSIEAMQEAAISKPKLTIQSRQIKKYVRVSIIDNGPGFSKEISKNLFNPYFTTKPHGMGIGLAICRTIIESHGGILTAKSLQKGACFQFNLPSEN